MNNDDFKKLTQALANSPKRKVSDKLILANVDKASNPIFRENLKKAVTSSEYRKNKSKISKSKWSDPAYIEIHAKAMKEAMSKDSYSKNMSAAQQKINDDPVKLKRKQDAVKKTIKTKEWKDALAKGQQDFRNDPVRYNAYMGKIMATRDQAAKNTRKALIADGVEYAGLTLCARALGIAIGTLQTRMKNHPDKYYYITK